MLSQKQIRWTCTRIGVSVATALLIALQVQTALAQEQDTQKPALRMVYCQISIEVSGDGSDTKNSDQLQLTTLEGNKATVEFGQQVTVPVGTMTLPGNRTVAQNYQRQDVGTIANIEPKIVGDQLIISLQIEKSWVEAPNSDSPTEIASRHTTFSVSAASVLALQNGKPEVLKANVAGSPGGQREATITVLASTKPIAAAKSAVERAKKARPTNRATAPAPRRSSDAAGSSGTHSKPARPESHDAHSDPKKSNSSKIGPAARHGSRPDSVRDGSANSRSRAERPTPAWVKNEGALRIFALIDKNKDGTISSTEWKSQRLAQSMASRGLKFSDKMNQQQFQEAVAAMVKGFRKDGDQKPDSAKENKQ